MSTASVLLALASGSIVGVMLAVTGAGGGILAIPLLIFVLQMDVVAAAPIGLMATGVAAAFGAAMGLRRSQVRYRAALLIGCAGMLTAPVGVMLARSLPAGPLAMVFAGVLMWVAVRGYGRTLSGANLALFGADDEQPPCVRNPTSGRFVWTAPCVRVLAYTGLGSGLLSGLLGVGRGGVIVPTLTRYSDLDAEGTVSTSLAVIALVSIAGVGAAAMHGSISWPIALPFTLGAVGAALIGRHLASALSAVTLQRAFAALCACVACLLVWRELHSVPS